MIGVVKLANCPKCNHELRLIDWKPECPNCGVNVLYYDFEERFYMDAKGAEIDAAKIRVKWTRVKASFIGSKLLVARLVLCVLPLVALLISFGSFKIVVPLFEKKMPMSLIGLFAFFGGGAQDFLTALKSAEAVGVYAKHAVNIFYGLSAVAAAAVLVLIFQLLCFISFRKMTILLVVSSGFGIIAAARSVIAVYVFSKVTTSAIFTVSNGYGGFVVIFSFVIIFALNVAALKKGLDVQYREGDLYRVEIARKVKRGEIKLEDLPQPVYPPIDTPADQRLDSAPTDGGSTHG